MKKVKNKPYPNPQKARIENLSHDGRGVARIEGKATFISGALPDEEVEFQYTKVKKDFDEGRLLSVIEASPLRVEPYCAHFQVCGGCSLQHIDSQAQIHLKQKQLEDLLTRYGQTTAQTMLAPLTSDSWHYRNKARLSVRFVEKKQAALVGFRERNNPRYIAQINQCPILHKKIDDDLVALGGLIESMDDKQCIAQIEVAAGDEQIALIFRNLNELSAEDALKLKNFAIEKNYLVFLQPGGPESVHRFYPQEGTDFLSYYLPDYQLTFKFHPTDFTQVNALLNRKMVSLALSLMELKNSDVVLDLFCGLGNFSLPMAKFCSNVLGVEGSKTMVERAYMNARANHLLNADFCAANLDDTESVRRIFQKPYNKILLDPPRSGALEIVNQIEVINPERIVYVSCNPITLARDTQILVHQKGYVLVKAGVMDMFPNTAHVESIALFEKG